MTQDRKLIKIVLELPHSDTLRLNNDPKYSKLTIVSITNTILKTMKL
jgi:hypothetical protein